MTPALDETHRSDRQAATTNFQPLPTSPAAPRAHPPREHFWLPFFSRALLRTLGVVGSVVVVPVGLIAGLLTLLGVLGKLTGGSDSWNLNGALMHLGFSGTSISFGLAVFCVAAFRLRKPSPAQTFAALLSLGLGVVSTLLL